MHLNNVGLKDFIYVNPDMTHCILHTYNSDKHFSYIKENIKINTKVMNMLHESNTL